jgi:pimeloyl-ACP methyl ester carboxylesterase
MKTRLFILFAWSLSLGFFIVSCKKDEPAPVQQEVIWQYIETYDLQKLNTILNTELEKFLVSSTMHAADFQGQFTTPEFPVKLYRVTYPTIVPELGISTVASGLVAIPDNGRDSMPVISYQHGTVAAKDDCPSNPNTSLETQLMIAQYASHGYILIGADMIGLGVSDQPHADFVRLTTEQACIDMLSAADTVLKAQKIKKGPLFLHGWSQGGWATMTFLRKLEALEIRVAAASTACAIADIFAIMDRWIYNPQPEDSPALPGFMANILFAYEYYSPLPGLTASAIKPEYYQASKDLYEWKLDVMSFLLQTTFKTREFFRPEFLLTRNVGNAPFWQALDQAQAYRWLCQTPLKMYYGEADIVTPVYLSTLPATYQNQMGSKTSAISAGAKADHRATFVYSLILVKPWFDEFLKK